MLLGHYLSVRRSATKFLFPILLLPLTCQTSPSPTNVPVVVIQSAPTAPHPEAVGLWSVPRHIHGANIRQFAYHEDGSVVIHLHSESELVWRTYDDYYRLESRWVDDILQYRPPFGDWSPLARYEDGRFLTIGGGSTLEYVRFTRETATGDEGVLLMERAMHDYNVEPTGEPEWRSKIPEHLLRWGGLAAREGDKITDAPGIDVAVARGYPLWKNKGIPVNGVRITIMTEKQSYAVSEEVRVIHVLEAIEAGHSVWVMGPKAIYGEHVDEVKQGRERPNFESYDGAVLESPEVDYNYEVSSYHFDEPGIHTIVWKDGERSSNVLSLEIQ